MSDASDYEYDSDMDMDDMDGDSSSQNDIQVSTSYENSLNQLIAKHRRVLADRSVSVPALEVGGVIDDFVREVSELFDMSQDDALAVLIYFQWNKEKLQEAYFNDPEKVTTELGLFPARPSLDLPFTCSICSESVTSPEQSSMLNCGHKTCLDCFSQYLHFQVSEGIGCLKAHCLQFKCKCVVPFEKFKSSLSPSDFERYYRFVIEDFIRNCSRMRWCTSPKCGLVVVAASSQVKSVRCSCSQCTCFQCGEEAHEPASCAQTKVWLDKCSEDFPTKKWILLNTKNCPYCKEAIEKNQGCNHMTCRSCRKEFCWICLGAWAEHNDNYRCNKPNLEKTGVAVDKDKLELERYVHFFERYHGHSKGMDYANDQMIKMMARIDLLDSHSRREHDFLQHAIKVLETVVDCRRVLKHTYVMGCFIDANDPKKGLFEHQQEMLEKNTELLSQYTEQSSFAEGEISNFVQITNLKGVTEDFKTNILLSMEDGRLLDNL